MNFREKLRLAFAFLCSICPGCQNYFHESGSDMNVCSMEAASGLNIVVQDQITQALITDASVTVIYSSRPSETHAVDYDTNCNCYLTWEDPAGQAAITIQKVGYNTATVSVQIERNQCHVKGQRVDIVLSP